MKNSGSESRSRRQSQKQESFSPPWRTGDIIVISGLRQRPEMNGAEGIVWAPICSEDPSMLVVRLNSTLSLVKVRHENASFARAPSGARSSRAGGPAWTSPSADAPRFSSRSGASSKPSTPSARPRPDPLDVDAAYIHRGQDDSIHTSHSSRTPVRSREYDYADVPPKTPESRRTHRRSSAAPETPGGGRDADRRRAATEEPGRWDPPPSPPPVAYAGDQRSASPELLSAHAWRERADAGAAYASRPLRELLEHHAPATAHQAGLCVRRLRHEAELAESAVAAAVAARGGPGADAAVKQLRLIDEMLSRVYTAADASHDRAERRPVIEEANAVQRKVELLQEQLSTVTAGSGMHTPSAASAAGTQDAGPAATAATAALQQRVRELEGQVAALAAMTERERALRQMAEKNVRELEARLGIV